jgi:23S rRNA (guanosine2251-2'-O)-methyltransferase
MDKKRYRFGGGQNLIAGRNPVIEALRAGTRLTSLLLLKGTHGPAIAEILRLAAQRGISVEEVDRKRFLTLAPGINVQGVAAFADSGRTVDIDTVTDTASRSGEAGFLLLLDQIEDTRNLGALVRTAECAGVHGVVLPRHHAAGLTPAAIKASAGATEHLPIAEVTNLVSTIDALKGESYWVVGLDAAGDRKYTEVDYRSPVALIVGSEGKGLRRLVRERCDFLVHIPMFGRIRSLNASVAGGLVMYEVRRQRQG